MSSRYGRNQRRAHRQQLAEAQTALASAERRADVAERRTATAMEEGMNRLLQIKHLPEVVSRIGVELGRAYGPEVAEAAQKILQSDRRGPREPVWLDARIDQQDFRVTVIRGVIKELHYNVAVSPF